MHTLEMATRLALENILFATDFSATSSRALSLALAIGRCYRSKIFAVHGVVPEPHYSVPLEPVPLDLDPMWQHARKKMKDYENSQAFGELRHETIVQHGDPWDVVSRVIRQNRIDLLILGTHGRTGIRKLVLGSQAEIIFRQAPCPVITVGPHLETVNADTWGPKTIIFATDFSDISAHALPFALSLAEENHSRLVLLHLAPLAPPDSDSDTEGSSIEKLSQLVPVQAKDRVQAEYVTRVDIPAEGILKIAEERNADLIVMGVRKRSIPSASAHLPWATASAVVSRACCPVLTVRG